MRTCNQIPLSDRRSRLKALFLGLVLAPIALQIQPALLAAQADRYPGSKSPTAAVSLSFLGTAGTMATSLLAKDYSAKGLLMLGGLAFGPLAGYGYLNRQDIGIKYVADRLMILGGTAGSIYLVCSIGKCNLFEDSGASDFAVVLGLIGFSAIVIHNFGDSIKVNRRAYPGARRFTVAPAYFPKAGSWGVSARFRF